MARKRGQMLDSYAMSKLWGPMALFCALIGYSRIYQGVHHPSDVLGSVGIGISWLTVCGVIRHFIGSDMEQNPSPTQGSEAGKDA
jgi:membrane-associated phospholipid phosphatase